MFKIKKIFNLLLLSLLILTLFLSGCGNNTTNKNKSPKAIKPTSPKVTKTTSKTTKVFTLSELKKYNGKNGNRAYVAISGVVYDVTNAKGWINGEHQGNSAGNDLTKQIKSSPHGNEVLKNLPIVGKLK